MDGSARLAALGTPTDISVQMNLDRQMVGALLDASTDAAMGNGKRDGHASQHGKLSLSRHRPESIGRHPRKVNKSHETGPIPVSLVNRIDAVLATLGVGVRAQGLLESG